MTPEVQREYDALRARLLEVFGAGPDVALGDSEFNSLALAAFHLQVLANSPYGAFVRGRGIVPGALSRWEDVPAVPTRGFKSVPLVLGDPGDAELVFRTSGTTSGGSRRGKHHLIDRELYERALLPGFQCHLLPDGVEPVVLALLPSPTDAPDSSLSYMIGTVMRALSLDGHFFVGGAGELCLADWMGALRAACASHRAVLLIGTAFSLVHALDGLRDRQERITLPEGSRVMETGGFKGRSRHVPREELYDSIHHLLGVAAPWIVNEYGMTEMLSQSYDGIAGVADEVLSRRSHDSPSWVRTRALDPVTLDPLPPGMEGLLAHFDLANLGSVCSVLTEDVGSVSEGRVRLRGRTPGSEPRGCSLTMEEFLAASRGIP